MPKVSIIVPNYNHSEFLTQRLESIFNQTFQDFEVILLDDCSTDDSVEILERYAKNDKVSSFVINEKNSGNTFEQWKKGINLAKTKYIWIAESDDWSDASFLEKTFLKIQQDSEISLVYSRSYRANTEGEILDINKWGENKTPERWEKDFINDGNLEIKDYLIYRNTIPNASAVLFQKEKGLEVLDSIKQYKYCGDWLFWAKIIQNSKIAFVSESLNYFRRYETATSLLKEKSRIKSRVVEYQKVIDDLGKIAKSMNYSNYQWIIDEWIASKKYFSMRQFLTPPLGFEIKKKFYKAILKKIVKLN